MLCCIHAIDNPGKDSLRSTLIKEQIEYVNTPRQLKIILAGPLAMQTDVDKSGSLLIVDAKSRNDVDHFIHQSPFFINGLWQQVMINKLTPTNNPAI